MTILDRLRRLLPTREEIAANRWLRWLAPLLSHPRLWHWSRRGVAIGVAVGMFFGLLMPIAQIPLSVAAAVILRVNVPAAAASTLVTNPVTFAPIYYGAYKLGIWVTGDDTAAANPNPLAASAAGDDASLWQRISRVGFPLFVGLIITATVAGVLCYAVISLGWYLYVIRKRRRSQTSRVSRASRASRPASPMEKTDDEPL